MAVYLLRNYQGFTASSTVPVTFPDSTEASLIAQGLATAAQTTAVTSVLGGPDQFVTQGGNVATAPQGGYTQQTYYQGPQFWPNIPLGSLALTSYETNGVAQTAGDFNVSEIYVPYYNTWTGAGVLMGTTVTSTSFVLALWGTSGALLANTAVAGTASVTASIFLNIPFTAKINLAPGRYFIGVQANNATDTVRHILSANGSNVITTKLTSGTFGTIPTFTVPTTFTTAVGPIVQLYT